MKSALLTVLLAAPSLALACPGKAETAADSSEEEEAVHAKADATRCAKKAEYVGGSCSYSTGMMAQRVAADGSELRFTAQLERNEAELDSKVAAPFVANGEYYVIANEVLDELDPSEELAFEGKALEVDGVKYFLVTGYKAGNS
jgi:hypothetical protein